ncbi:outer membrane beta-barrel protein [Legionella donaldsonii]|uniref:outer membrane beta-barrel protein n=1 Tax=Legionella donaldsonii TaxID=45060 RepID=UPI00399C82BD
MNIILLLIINLSFISIATANQLHDSQSPSQSTADTLTNNWKVFGYLDGSYNYLLRSNQFISGTYDRVFDIKQNGLTLQQTGMNLAYQPQEGFGGLITPVVGRDAQTFAPYGWITSDPSQEIGFAIPQGYLQYTAASLTFMAGAFIELAGAENLFSYNDTNFSRSILWGYAEPFTVTGLRVSYIPNNKLTLIGGLNNGWDNIRDTSRGKTIELGASYVFNPMFSLATYLYSGQQRVTERTSYGPTGQRTLLDLVATLNITEKISFVVNYDGAQQTRAALPNGTIAKAIWQGVAGYFNYKFSEKWRTSLRGEIFSDKNGYRTGVAQTWKEITLTVGYELLQNFELRAETRHDISNVNAFLKANNKGTSNNQQSYAIEIVGKFL